MVSKKSLSKALSKAQTALKKAPADMMDKAIDRLVDAEAKNAGNDICDGKISVKKTPVAKITGGKKR